MIDDTTDDTTDDTITINITNNDINVTNNDINVTNNDNNNNNDINNNNNNNDNILTIDTEIVLDINTNLQTINVDVLTKSLPHSIVIFDRFECPICLETMENNQGVLIPECCNTKVHLHCLTNWYTANPNNKFCFMCNQSNSFCKDFVYSFDIQEYNNNQTQLQILRMRNNLPRYRQRNNMVIAQSHNNYAMIFVIIIIAFVIIYKCL